LRIGILEWICGGGLQYSEPTPIAESLLNEGWAMLRTVAQDFVSCGHDVTTCVDARLLEGLKLPESRFQVTFNSGFTNDLPSRWWMIASEADAVVVIAPEFANILQTAISKLTPVCKLLLNCNGDFLASSCDKWLTAQKLNSAHINHPATHLTCDVTESWLQQHHNESGRWIIKPRDGAGCEAIQLVSHEFIKDTLSTIRSGDSNSRMMIQPLHSGTAFSRSAIVDGAGRFHWLPLVTQEFTDADSIVYCGGRVLVGKSHYEDTLNGKRYSIDRLDKVLNATVEALGQGARGWVGVDLLFSDLINDWLVIEVNPRLTTSFTGLSKSNGPGLTEQMLRAGQGLDIAIKPTWKTIEFSAAGTSC
jgi:tyramine---L-glutamate ligase